MQSSWIDNFRVYFDNLSLYYVLSVVVSFLALCMAWWYQSAQQAAQVTGDPTEFENVPSEDGISNTGLLTKIKLARQEAIEQELAAGLTDQQLQQERETEQAQLAAIFKLLQQQQEKFQVTSMEELHDQLKLYRR